MRGLVAGLLAFAVYFGLQTSVFHFVKITRRARVLISLWLLCLPAYPLLFWGLPDDRVIWLAPLVAPSDAITFLCGGLLYFFIFMGYAQFIYMAESSVGVRTMIELTSEPEKGLTLEELTKRYPHEWMMERRLRRMVRTGYLVEQDGWYRTTARGRLTAAALAWSKRLLRLGPGG